MLREFELMKVFDCQSMPEDTRRMFFDTWDHYGNDIIIEWFIETINPTVVDRWLFENGATKEDKSVLIKHWW